MNTIPYSEIKRSDYSYLLIPLIFSAYLAFVLIPLFQKIPVSAKISDIIPQIQIAVQRMLAGKNPYISPINFDSYSLYITYLPLHWLPYSISEVFHFDYRWITFCIWNIGALALCVRVLQVRNMPMKLILPVLLYLSYFIIYVNDDSILSMTVETMIAGYYMLLITGLNQRGIFLNALFITFCLLSRYSIALWLPLWAFVLVTSGNKKSFYLTTILTILLVSVIYVIPFLSKDWNTFYLGLKEHDSGTIGEWQHYNAEGLPMHLYSGVGFAHLVYENFQGFDLMQKIKVIQKIHLAVSAGIVLLMGVWFWFNRKKIDHRIFLMGSLKIYLAIFLAFIQLPYVYLMIVGNFVSIAIFAEQARYKINTSN